MNDSSRTLINTLLKHNALRKFRAKAKSGGTRARGSAIPTGLCLSARGCEERATLGLGPWGSQPQGGCVTFWHLSCNRVAVVEIHGTRTRGSSFLATLGFEPESRWDSCFEFRKASGFSALHQGVDARTLSVRQKPA